MGHKGVMQTVLVCSVWRSSGFFSSDVDLKAAHLAHVIRVRRARYVRVDVTTPLRLLVIRQLKKLFEEIIFALVKRLLLLQLELCIWGLAVCGRGASAWQ